MFRLNFWFVKINPFIKKHQKQMQAWWPAFAGFIPCVQ